VDEEKLDGGRTFGAVRIGDEVHRPVQQWTATVHALLNYLQERDFAGAPRVIGFDGAGREVLTYLPGSTLGDTNPWPEWLRSDAALTQVGAWLRNLHEVTAGFVAPDDAIWFTGTAWRPGLIIGHQDASPWNVVWQDGRLVGFVDWDTASPSSPDRDLAFTALTWVPLLARRVAESTGFTDFDDRSRRLHLLLDAYGFDGDRLAFRDTVIARANRNIEVIRHLADTDEPDPVFVALLPWADDLEESVREIEALEDEFWTRDR
jgi:Ser/Thr protein kinase RdoA (MazF antagonist)